MIIISWYIFIIFITSISVIWLLENNGSMVINWLDYQVQTDIFTAILIIIFICALLIFITNILTRLLAIRFPQLLKFFFKKNYTSKLEKIILKHHQGLDELLKLLLAMENDEITESKKLHKNFQKLIKHNELNNFLLGKFALEDQDFDRAKKIFSHLHINDNSKILFLKTKLKIAINKQQDLEAIDIAKEILSIKKDNVKIAQELLKLYRKNAKWHDAKKLIDAFGAKKLSAAMQHKDIMIINCAIALEYYTNKKYLKAFKHVRMALKYDQNFLPANVILIKLLIKFGFKFLAIRKLKYNWKKAPHLIYSDIFSQLHRRKSKIKRLKLIKKFAFINHNSILSNIAIARCAFRCCDYLNAKEYLNLALTNHQNYNLYNLLAHTEKFLGNQEEYIKNLKIAHNFPKENYYHCSNCHYSSNIWQATCNNCGSFDSYQY